VRGGSAREKIGRGTWEAQRGRGENPNSVRESITLSWPLRESDRLIVAGKRVMTVERRGLNDDVLG